MPIDPYATFYAPTSQEMLIPAYYPAQQYPAVDSYGVSTQAPTAVDAEAGVIADSQSVGAIVRSEHARARRRDRANRAGERDRDPHTH